MDKVTQQQNQLNNLTHTVAVIQKFAHMLDKDHTDIRNSQFVSLFSIKMCL